MKKFHFVYVTTNLVNNKQYVGDHSTDNLNDSYLGSGLLLHKAIKKYKKLNFKREILEICESKEDAFILQEKYINKYNTLQPIGYNISPKGGHNVKGCFSEESKNKISKNRTGKCIGNEHHNFNKHLSKETREKIGEKNKINSKGEKNGMYQKDLFNIWVDKFGIKKATELYLQWKNKISDSQLNKITDIKTKQRQSVAAINRKKYKCSHCGKEYDSGNFNQHIKSLERKGIVDSYWVLETLIEKESLY